MPRSTFAILILSVLLAAGATVWLLSAQSIAPLAMILPAALVLSFVLRRIGK